MLRSRQKIEPEFAPRRRATFISFSVTRYSSGATSVQRQTVRSFLRSALAGRLDGAAGQAEPTGQPDGRRAAASSLPLRQVHHDGLCLFTCPAAIHLTFAGQVTTVRDESFASEQAASFFPPRGTAGLLSFGISRLPSAVAWWNVTLMVVEPVFAASRIGYISDLPGASG